MSDNTQNSCAICTEAFQEGEIVTSFRVWPDQERLGHIDCIISLLSDEEEDDED
jgi:hypothetical protein